MAVDVRTLTRLVHREMIQLGVLVVVAVVAFFGTRTMATASHRLAEAEAAEWFQRGNAAIATGRPDEAAEAFRRAAVRRPSNRAYGLALAAALGRSGDADAAWRELLALRNAAPEDPDINSALARIAVARGDDTAARRFYDNALYASWPVGRSADRRAVRVEVIRFLITRGDRGRALSELLAVTSTAPLDPSSQVELAALYADAGDDRRALDHFRQALSRDPADARAVAGAGLAAFRLRDYRTASAYL